MSDALAVAIFVGAFLAGYILGRRRECLECRRRANLQMGDLEAIKRRAPLGLVTVRRQKGDRG